MLGMCYSNEKLTETHMSETAAQHHIGLSLLTNVYSGIGSSIGYIGHLLTVYLTIEALNKVTNEKHSTTARTRTAPGKASHTLWPHWKDLLPFWDKQQSLGKWEAPLSAAALSFKCVHSLENTIIGFFHLLCFCSFNNAYLREESESLFYSQTTSHFVTKCQYIKGRWYLPISTST